MEQVEKLKKTARQELRGFVLAVIAGAFWLYANIAWIWPVMPELTCVCTGMLYALLFSANIALAVLILVRGRAALQAQQGHSSALKSYEDRLPRARIREEE